MLRRPSKMGIQVRHVRPVQDHAGTDRSADIVAAVNGWNASQPTHSLASSVGDTANMMISLYNKIMPGYVLGATSVNCAAAAITPYSRGNPGDSIWSDSLAASLS